MQLTSAIGIAGFQHFEPIKIAYLNTINIWAGRIVLFYDCIPGGCRVTGAQVAAAMPNIANTLVLKVTV